MKQTDHNKIVWADGALTEETASWLSDCPEDMELLGFSYTELYEDRHGVEVREKIGSLCKNVIRGFGHPLADLPRTEEAGSPVSGIREALGTEKDFWIVLAGPLTNIAVLISCQPELRERLAGIMILGGGAYEGDVLPAVERSFHADPEAALIVVQSGVPLFLIPFEMKQNPLQILLHMEDCRWEDAFVDVDLYGAKTRGASVIDFHSKITGRKTNARVLTGDYSGNKLKHGHV